MNWSHSPVPLTPIQCCYCEIVPLSVEYWLHPDLDSALQARCSPGRGQVQLCSVPGSPLWQPCTSTCVGLLMAFGSAPTAAPCELVTWEVGQGPMWTATSMGDAHKPVRALRTTHPHAHCSPPSPRWGSDAPWSHDTHQQTNGVYTLNTKEVNSACDTLEQ